LSQKRGTNIKGKFVGGIIEEVDMAIEYRRLTAKELDTFIEMRINQLREEGATEDIDLRPALKDYYNRHMKDGTFVSLLALDEMKKLPGNIQ
jgi:hypothetical protein